MFSYPNTESSRNSSEQQLTQAREIQRDARLKKRAAEDGGQHPGDKKPRTPETSEDVMKKNAQKRNTEIVMSIDGSSSGSLVNSSMNVHRSLWPVRGANNEVTTIAISTNIALNPEFWPISSLCGNFLPTPMKGRETDQLPLTQSEIESTKPHHPLSDWEVYHILRLGLGRTMAKNHKSDLRVGVGSIRIKRPNRGRAAKIKQPNGTWVYGQWQSSRGRTYQLFGNEGVIAGLDNRTDGEILCVSQPHDEPDEDKVPELLASESLVPCLVGCERNMSNHSAFRPIANSTQAYDSPYWSEQLQGRTYLSLGSQLGLEVAEQQSATTSNSGCETAHFHHGSYGMADPSGQDEPRSGNYLGQLEMKFPPSDVWLPLARGERWRINAICPIMDSYAYNLSASADPGQSIQYRGVQLTYGTGTIDPMPDPFSYLHSLDFSGLTGASNPADHIVTGFDYGGTQGIRDAEYGNAYYGMPALETGNWHNMLDLDGGDFYEAQNSKGEEINNRNIYTTVNEEGYQCDYHPNLETDSEDPKYFHGRLVPSSLFRRRSA